MYKRQDLELGLGLSLGLGFGLVLGMGVWLGLGLGLGCDTLFWCSRLTVGVVVGVCRPIRGAPIGGSVVQG